MRGGGDACVALVPHKRQQIVSSTVTRATDFARLLLKLVRMGTGRACLCPGRVRFFGKGVTNLGGVILSAAKNLSPSRTQILRCAQDDRRKRRVSINPTSERRGLPPPWSRQIWTTLLPCATLPVGNIINPYRVRAGLAPALALKEY